MTHQEYLEQVRQTVLQTMPLSEHEKGLLMEAKLLWCPDQYSPRDFMAFNTAARTFNKRPEPVRIEFYKPMANDPPLLLAWVLIHEMAHLIDCASQIPNGIVKYGAHSKSFFTAARLLGIKDSPNWPEKEYLFPDNWDPKLLSAIRTLPNPIA